MLLAVVLTAACTSGTPDAASRTTTAPSVAPPAAAPDGWWRPTVGLTWQLQLTGPVDGAVDADVFDLDLFETPASTVADLQRRGRRVVCYFSAGSHEDWRSDAQRFPAAVLGKPLVGWPGERWLDVRRTDAILPVLEARLDLCRAKGFDGADPDNVDGYANDSGFPLTAAQQVRFNRLVAEAAHRRGLAVGLKNDLGQVGVLVDIFDFAVNEQCVEYDECAALAPFIAAAKPVFHVEYERRTATFCAQARRRRFASIRKRLELGAWRQTCPPST